MRPGECGPVAPRFTAWFLLIVGVTITANMAALAQPAASVTLTLTVVDPSGAPIDNAIVAVAEHESAIGFVRVTQTAQGVARFEVSPGVYAVQISAAGFKEQAITGLRIGSRQQARTVRLELETVVASVLVERTPRDAALDPRGFATVLTREQIDALPDDPEEMLRMLRELAPPGAQIRIDGFTGGAMPSKSQILSIRIPRLDSFAAQDHGGLSASSYIDIVTRPGGGRMQGSMDGTFRHHALDARNALSAERPTTIWRTGAFSADGPLLRDTASFNVAVRTGRQQDMATVRAALPEGLFTDSVPRQTDLLVLTARTSLRLGSDTTLRVGLTSNRQSLHNAGIGDFDLRERGMRIKSADTRLQIAAGGPWGRQRLWEARSQVRWGAMRTDSLTAAPTIRVLDAFTSGGAQVSGGSRATGLDSAFDLDLLRGHHSWRVGVAVESEIVRTNRQVNHLGTYTFASLADFASGRPATYTRRLGRADARYSNVQLGLYVQDDVRVARSLVLNYGLRYEQQSLARRSPAFMPRGGLTWSPMRSGRLVVRAGAGVFSDWVATSTYEQSRLVDGSGQRDVLITSPAYPLGEDQSSIFMASDRYVFDTSGHLPASRALSIGVEQQATATWRLVATYTQRTGWDLQYGRNLNRLADGFRPDPASGNVIKATNGAAFESRTTMAQAIRLAPRGRLDIAAAYVYTRQMTNTLGPYSLPAIALESDWGIAAPLHAATVSLTARPISKTTITLTPRWRSGAPYTVTTGRDDNGDGFLTDRPIGVARNNARTTALWEIGLRLAYTMAFGRQTDAASDSARVRVELFAAAQNATNHASFVGYSGVATSPFFGRPIAAASPRRMDLGFRVAF